MKTRTLTRGMLYPLVPVMLFTGSVLAGQQHGPDLDSYNIPKEIETCVRSVDGLKIRGTMNPFYLSGDFDGDGNLDFAVQVQRGDADGILLCLTTQRIPTLLGAGSSVLWPSNGPWRFDAWSIVPRNSKAVSHPSGVHRDAILLEIKETASGLLYWDGKKFAWKQLID